MVHWPYLLLAGLIGWTLGLLCGWMTVGEDESTTNPEKPMTENKQDNGSIYPYSSPAQRMVSGKMKVPSTLGPKV
jgi:hypothetical protein